MYMEMMNYDVNLIPETVINTHKFFHLYITYVGLYLFFHKRFTVLPQLRSIKLL